MDLFRKIRWLLGLGVVFLLILGTSRTNVVNYQRVQASVEEIYEDRLVVKGLIFELARGLHEKELAHVGGDEEFFLRTNEAVDAGLEESLERFRATRLTPQEELTLNRFAANVDRLKTAEAATQPPQDMTPELSQLFEALDRDLDALAEIQLAEGRRQLALSDKAVSDMNLGARLQMFMLGLLATAMLCVALFVPTKAAA